MSIPLRVLVLEDDAYDAELEIMTLEEAGYSCQWDCVETEREFSTCLRSTRYDLILADYNLPTFDGLTALKLMQEHTPDIPFILVSGKLGEEVAIESLKAGATDYVLKQRLSRLGPVVERALREKMEYRQRRQAEAALRESEVRMRVILDSAVDSIITVNEWGVIESFNRAAEQSFGYQAQEVIGHNVKILMPPPYYEAHDGYMARYRDTGEKKIIGIGREVVGRRKDGATFPVELTVTEAYLEDRRIFTAILRDITERKQLEAQLLHSQKMEALGQLAGGVAHDFNNLLTVIMGYSVLLLNNHLDKADPIRYDVERIKQAAKQGTMLTRQLLAFGRKQILQPQVLNLNDTVRIIDKMVGRLIGEDIHLTTLLEPALGTIRADPGQLEQMMMNLVINARDAMPAGGILTIKTGNVDLEKTRVEQHTQIEAGPYVLLTVSDTGVGMDAETQSHIFEPFFTTKAPGKGTGLGLSTVYGIVKQSAGYISVHSRPQQGTTFKIYLPRVREACQSAAQPPEPVKVDNRTETILLVEDDSMVRELVKLVLNKDGYTVLTADHGHEALEVNEQYQGPIHLLVTDLVMPRGISGQELAERLSHLHPDMAILYTSGYVDDETLQQLSQANGVTFLPKPFAPTTLAQKVREVLSHSK